MVRFLVSDFGISWVESRDGHELVKFEGAEAIQELQRVAQLLQQVGANPATAAVSR
jgi:sulfur carrier protein ThiS